MVSRTLWEGHESEGPETVCLRNSSGILSEKVRECDELLMELAGYVERHVGTMNPQELSSCFVTGVKVGNASPEVQQLSKSL